MTTTAPANTQQLIEQLLAIVGQDGMISSQAELLVYECDAYTLEKNKPDVVVFPTSTEHVVEIVKVCQKLGVPFLPGTMLPTHRAKVHVRSAGMSRPIRVARTP